ncbi:MAG: hypothetical protein V3V01_02775, partial [Acidimicrobiales bacterium]
LDPNGAVTEDPVLVVEAADNNEGPVGADDLADDDSVDGADDDLNDVAEQLIDVSDQSSDREADASVDELFERLRADREARVAQAAELLDTDTDAAQLQPTERPSGGSGGVDTLVRSEVETEASQRLQQAELAMLARRSKLESLEKTAARKLKRVLADEQNELLDLVRRSEPDVVTIDEVASDLGAHSRSYVDAIADELSEAATAGAESIGDETVAFDPVATATLVADQLVSVLRLRCDQAISDSDNSEDAISHLRSIYREIRSQRLGDVASSLVVSAYGDGAFAGLEPREPVRWELAPDSACGQHCTDNVVGGAVAAGERFASGHSRPPASPDCRCFLVREI